MKRVVCLLALLVCAVLLSACGASTKVSRVHGVIEIGGGVKSSSLVKSVLGVGVGTSTTAMRQRLGAASGKEPIDNLTCWVYRAHQPGYTNRELDFCVSRKERVSAISLGAIHG